MSKGDAEFQAHVKRRKIAPPKILYKYTTIDTARKILSSSKIRFQSPLRYNDPFDSQWNVYWPLYTAEAKEYEKALLKQLILDPSVIPSNINLELRRAIDAERSRICSLPPRLRDAAVSQFVLSAMNNGTPVRVQQRMNDTQRRLRVFCLCENIESILMWSHYADHHRGVVFGFDTSTLENHFRRPLEPVNYCKSLPCLIDNRAWIRSAIFGLPLPAPLGADREWALSKHFDWKYEQEWRFTWVADKGTIGDYEDFPIPNGALVEIIVGCRTADAEMTELLLLSREFHPQIRQRRMTIHPHQFALVMSEIEM